MTVDLPLTGLKIVVTRPRDQAVQLAQRIEQAGGMPLLFPLLDIEAVSDSRMLQQQIARLAQFNLAIFISPNAVHYGMAAIRAALSPTPSPACGRGERDSAGEGAVLSLPASLKIATVGQGSARALRELGVAQVIAPVERFDSEGLLALPDLQYVAGWRVLIFRGDGGRELLGDTLKARGATVEYACCYQRSKPQLDVGALLANAPDAITVTSSEALAHLWQVLDGEASALRETPLFVPHERIAALARQQGWPQVHLTPAGDDGLLAALAGWADKRKAPSSPVAAAQR